MSYQKTGWNDCPPLLDIAPHGPRRKKTASGAQLNQLNNGFLSGGEACVTEVSNEQVILSFNRVVALPNRLKEKEFLHYVKKLKVAFLAALENSEYKQLINKVLDDVLELQDAAKAKSLLINFMLVNPGVASWALPLRKIVENVG